MRQTAQVIRTVSPGYVEVKVRRASACASAHNCGSCDHCSFMENAPEIVVVAEDDRGAQVGGNGRECYLQRSGGRSTFVYRSFYPLF